MAIETTANNKHENWVWKGISRDLGYDQKKKQTNKQNTRGIRVALTAFGI